MANGSSGNQTAAINSGFALNSNTGQTGLRIFRDSSKHGIGSVTSNQSIPFIQGEFGGGSGINDDIWSITYQSSTVPGKVYLNTDANHASIDPSTYPNWTGAHLVLGPESGVNLSGGIFRPDNNNTHTLGDGSFRWTQLYASNGTINTSDSRLKVGITTSPLGLDFINRLRPVSYKWVIGENEVQRDENGSIIRKDNSREIITAPIAGKRDHYGLIAQEVKQTLDAVGIGSTEFAGWCLTDKNNPDSTQSLRYSEFIAPIIKSIQEQQELISQLQTQNANLLSRIESLESE